MQQILYEWYDRPIEVHQQFVEIFVNYFNFKLNCSKFYIYNCMTGKLKYTTKSPPTICLLHITNIIVAESAWLRYWQLQIFVSKSKNMWAQQNSARSGGRTDWSFFFCGQQLFAFAVWSISCFCSYSGGCYNRRLFHIISKLFLMGNTKLPQKKKHSIFGTPVGVTV